MSILRFGTGESGFFDRMILSENGCLARYTADAIQMNDLNRRDDDFARKSAAERNKHPLKRGRIAVSC